MGGWCWGIALMKLYVYSTLYAALKKSAPIRL